MDTKPFAVGQVWMERAEANLWQVTDVQPEFVSVQCIGGPRMSLVMSWTADMDLMAMFLGGAPAISHDGVNYEPVEVVPVIEAEPVLVEQPTEAPVHADAVVGEG